LTPAAEAPPKKKLIFIVDDHPIFRQGLLRLIESEHDLGVCGEAGSAAQALDGLRRTRADAAVIDISLPGTDGIELVKHLRAEHPEMPLLVISAHDEKVYALRALRAGASGYLMKTEGDGYLLPALRKTLAGEVWVSPSFGEQIIYKVVHGAEAETGPLDALSDRELEVLRLVGAGNSTQEMANMLHLSVKTVESHRLHIKEKLALKTSGELVRFAQEWVRQQAG
jgi:DNA-binding NarL/FixJ family response regulator